MARKNIFITLSVIVLVATLTQISTDIYIPSLPAIAQSLNATLGQSQLTLALFISGVACFTLIYGPLSEGIGRRLTIIFGLSIAMIGSVCCLFANTIHILQLGRFIQGCGLGACASLWRSIFRDTYSGADLARVSSYLVNLVTLSVIISPFIGGYFEQYLGWRSTFVFLLCWMTLVLLVVVFLFKETSQHHHKDRLSRRFIVKAFIDLLSNRCFMSFSLIVFLAYGGLLSWLIAGPIVFIHTMGLSPVSFGHLMILSGLSTALGGLVNGQLTKKLSMSALMVVGMCLMIVAGFAMLLGYILVGLYVSVILIPAMIFIFGSTFVFMNCFALAFDNVGHVAGYAGSLYSFIQLLGGVVFGVVLAHVNTKTPVPMAVMFTVSGLGCGFIYIAAKKQLVSS